jgi:hypothetical protein
MPEPQGTDLTEEEVQALLEIAKHDGALTRDQDQPIRKDVN